MAHESVRYDLPGDAGGELRQDERDSRTQADLAHESHQVVEEVLLDDLSVAIPAGNGAEIHVERLASGRDLFAVESLHRPRHRAREVGNGAGPVAGGEEDAVGP